MRTADYAPGQCCSVNVTGIVCPVSRLRDHVTGVIMTRLLSLLVLASFLVMSLSAPSAICPHLNPRKTDRMHNLKLQFLFMMTQKKITLSFSSLVFCPLVSRVLNVDTRPGCQEINSVWFLRGQGGSHGDGCRAVFLALFR